MASTDVAIPVIQLIALFLPAWAVVMQVFAKLVRDTDLQDEPLLIPFFAFGFALSGVSLYLFGRAGSDIMIFFVEEGLIEGSGPLAQALGNVGLGSLAFVGLGHVVLLSIAFRHIALTEVKYIAVLSFLYISVMSFGLRLHRPRIMLLFLFLCFSVSLVLIRRIYSPKEAVFPRYSLNSY